MHDGINYGTTIMAIAFKVKLLHRATSSLNVVHSTCTNTL